MQKARAQRHATRAGYAFKLLNNNAFSGKVNRNPLALLRAKRPIAMRTVLWNSHANANPPYREPAMPQIHTIAVGRLRETHWRLAVETYAARLKRGYDLVETVIKDGDSSLAPHDRSALEGERILQALRSACMPVCLDERGETFSSVNFARFLRQTFNAARVPCFIIGGAYGLSDAVRERAAKLLSLGPMTLPHELARVVLYEQVYRADAILHGRPYHHG